MTTADLAGLDGQPAELGADSPAPPTTRRRWVAALRSGPGLAGLIIFAAVVLIGVAAPLLTPYSPTAQLDDANLLGSSAAHPLGTDQVNRDVWARVAYGIRADLIIVFLGVPLGAVIGGLSALLAVTFAVADVALQRLFDVVLAFPTLIFAIGLTAVTGPGTGTVIAVIATVEAPIFARVLRTSLLATRSLPFVEAATTIGAGRWWILRRHLLPNSLEPVVVQLAISLSLGVFIESAMSFLGLGVRPPAPSLGNLVSEGIDYADTSIAYVLGPLTVIIALVLALQLLARALGQARRIRR